MIKINGKEYPASFFKLVLADPIVRNLDFIRDHLGLSDNIATFSLAINTTYNLLQMAIKKQKENKDIKEATEEAIDNLRSGKNE